MKVLGRHARGKVRIDVPIRIGMGEGRRVMKTDRSWSYLAPCVLEMSFVRLQELNAATQIVFGESVVIARRLPCIAHAAKLNAM